LQLLKRVNGVEWHYGLADEKRGPVAVEELQRLFRDGVITSQTRVWRAGMGDWQPIHAVAELSAKVQGSSGAGPVGGKPRRRKMSPLDWIIGGVVSLALLGIGYGIVYLVNNSASNANSAFNGFKNSVGLVVCGYKYSMDNDKYEELICEGTAFVVTESGYLLTNKHVVEDVWKLIEDPRMLARTEKELSATNKKEVLLKPTVWVFINASKSAAKIVHVSEKYDLAILKIESDEPLRRLALSAQADPQPLTEIVAAGFPGVNRDPLTLEESIKQFLAVKARQKNIEKYYEERHFQVDVTTGTINQVLHPRGEVKLIKHQAKIHKGNSGGPLATKHGIVLGINTYTGIKKEDDIFLAQDILQMRREIDKHVPGVTWR